MIEAIIKELSQCSEVEAITLGGSRGRDRGDEYSDYDIYVYLTEELDRSKRKDILEKYCSYIEIGNEFWEQEDDGILNSGIDIEFIYRKIEDIAGNLRYVVEECGASMGYTTCFWENVINSKILYDRDGRMKKLIKKYDIEYPEKLQKNIVEKNHKLLIDYMPSLYYQIDKAVKRGDSISINHRTTEFMSIYFDIIFAVNRKKHTGEKRIIETTKEFELLPRDYVQLLEDVFGYIYRNNDQLLETLEKICLNLYELLKGRGYNVSYKSYKSYKS